MLYSLIDKLEKLIEKWEKTPYTGDLTKAARTGCARELRDIIGSSEPAILPSQTEREWYCDCDEVECTCIPPF